MKAIFTFIFLIIGFFSYAQFHSLRYERKIESVSLFWENEQKKDTVMSVDTVFYKNDSLTINKPITRSEQSLFTLPLKNITITSLYGNRYHPIDKEVKFHYGIDLRANNDTIYSIYNSTVVDAGYNNNLGHYIKIAFHDFIITYGHLQYYFYKVNDVVGPNVAIGITGNTGKSTAPHLHFSVQKNGVYINPVAFISTILKANQFIKTALSEVKPPAVTTNYSSTEKL